MKNTQLEDMTDAELSEAFALEVAGWRKNIMDEWEDTNGKAIWDDFTDWPGNPNFATSADAVLPWLEKYGKFNIHHSNGGIYEVEIDRLGQQPCNFYFGSATTMARAAAIALIKAKRNAT